MQYCIQHNEDLVINSNVAYEIQKEVSDVTPVVDVSNYVIHDVNLTESESMILFLMTLKK